MSKNPVQDHIPITPISTGTNPSNIHFHSLSCRDSGYLTPPATPGSQDSGWRPFSGTWSHNPKIEGRYEKDSDSESKLPFEVHGKVLECSADFLFFKKCIF